MITTGKNREYNRPEYSFWAEKVMGSSQVQLYSLANLINSLHRHPQEEDRTWKGIYLLFKAKVFGIGGSRFVGVVHLLQAESRRV